jgi:nicotinamidase-related amidase
MPGEDKNGIAPDTSELVLLIVDMISDFEFEDGDKLYTHALPMARNLAGLKLRTREAGVPEIFVNDNFGRWRDDFGAMLACANASEKGREIANLLAPDKNDYYVLKPKHSGFYSTALEVLLEYLGARRLVITGVTTDICILFTANDAYMRDYELMVPADCVAAVKPEQNEYALEYIARVLKTDTRESGELEL